MRGCDGSYIGICHNDNRGHLVCYWIAPSGEPEVTNPMKRKKNGLGHIKMVSKRAMSKWVRERKKMAHRHRYDRCVECIDALTKCPNRLGLCDVKKLVIQYCICGRIRR